MRHRDSGIILVNVLVTLALGAALVLLMFSSQDNLIDRSRRAAAVSQAEALAMGGEASMVAALTRDMIVAPDTDNLTEDWALIQQDTITLATGRFTVVITDAQSRFDINQLMDGGFMQTQILASLIAQAELPLSLVQQITAEVQTFGPLQDLNDLRDVDAATLNTLKTVLVALPVAGDVNLNTAPLPVLTAVIGNAAVARGLVSLRDRQGFVEQQDLSALATVPLSSIGFTSDVFDIVVTAEISDVTVTLFSRVLRLHRTPAEREVRVIARRFGLLDYGKLE